MKAELASKMLAGVLPGFGLALALCGLYGWYGPGSLVDRYMVLLWLLVPVWTAIFCLSLLFRRACHAWWALTCANIAAFGALHLLRSLMAQAAVS